MSAEAETPATWLKHKHHAPKFAKQIASKGGGDSSIRRKRRKLNAAEKAKLPVQPKYTLYVGPNGKSKMVPVD